LRVVAFESFTKGARAGAHVQRFAIAASAAACVMVLVGIASANLGGKKEERPVEEETIDVTFAEELPEVKEEAPPPPPPAAAPPIAVPEHVKVSTAPPPPPPPVPTEVPKGKLDEADPSLDKGVAGGSHDGESTGVAGGAPGGTGTVVKEAPTVTAAAPPPPPPPPMPKPAGPSMVSETDIPAKAISNPPPPYPEAARAAGLTARIVVRLTIDETGKVVAAKILKGDPSFDAVVMQTVMTWKYEPARHADGTPFLSTKTIPIPFKIKT
jgi:periplasmic protein TonB